ncbi:MAG TPA: nitrilase-related carbon-nitrogen hydrolase [Chloroflexota bacterium]|nr:nitrilase-related carbon-nitrogen hydrolase [Chloroflexota bacterium]
MRVALAQITPKLGDLQANLDKHLELIAQARQGGANLLVFPELSLTGYFLEELAYHVSLRRDSDELRQVAEAAGDMAVVLGFCEETPDYRYYISAAFIEQGAIKHLHRKVYLPTYGMFTDQRYFAEGDRFRAFDASFGRCGLLVCEDAWHSSAVSILAADGADYLICINSSPGRGIVTGGRTLGSSDAWEMLTRTHAQFFTSFFMFCNRVGYEDGINFWGGSEVIGPDGECLGKAPYFDEGFTCVEIDPSALRRVRINLPLLRDEKLELTLREYRRVLEARYGDR